MLCLPALPKGQFAPVSNLWLFLPLLRLHSRRPHERPQSRTLSGKGRPESRIRCKYPIGKVFYTPEDGDAIVDVALTQVGNVGGEPYWSWYGFSSHVERCACFVSWCADQCGYLASGAYPKFSGCVFGMQWFQQRGLWLDSSTEPAPGMLIYFDWAPQDEVPDHVGIVEKVENGMAGN